MSWRQRRVLGTNTAKVGGGTGSGMDTRRAGPFPPSPSTPAPRSAQPITYRQNDTAQSHPEYCSYSLEASG